MMRHFSTLSKLNNLKQHIQSNNIMLILYLQMDNYQKTTIVLLLLAFVNLNPFL